MDGVVEGDILVVVHDRPERARPAARDGLDRPGPAALLELRLGDAEAGAGQGIGVAAEIAVRVGDVGGRDAALRRRSARAPARQWPASACRHRRAAAAAGSGAPAAAASSAGAEPPRIRKRRRRRRDRCGRRRRALRSGDTGTRPRHAPFRILGRALLDLASRQTRRSRRPCLRTTSWRRRLSTRRAMRRFRCRVEERAAVASLAAARHQRPPAQRNRKLQRVLRHNVEGAVDALLDLDCLLRLAPEHASARRQVPPPQAKSVSARSTRRISTQARHVADQHPEPCSLSHTQILPKRLTALGVFPPPRDNLD